MKRVKEDAEDHSRPTERDISGEEEESMLKRRNERSRKKKSQATQSKEEEEEEGGKTYNSFFPCLLSEATHLKRYERKRTEK